MLYILFYIGMGIFQPLMAIIRLLQIKRYNSTYAIGIKRYLWMVIGYFILMYFFIELDNYNNFMGLYTFILPWALAIYYMRHIFIWSKKNKRIQAFDEDQKLLLPHEDRLILDSFPQRKINLVREKDRRFAVSS